MLQPGLGHIYCGEFLTGMILMAMSTTFVVVMFLIISLLAPTTIVVLSILAVLAVSLLISLYSIVDAYRIAKRKGNDYQLKDYNRPAVYLLFLGLGTFGCVSLPFFVKGNVIQAFYIPTGSNSPTILPSDRLLANKWVYQYREPQPGELVVFRNPEKRRQHWIKRIVATAGDTIAIKQGRVFVNDIEITREADDNSSDVYWEGQEANVYRVLIDDRAKELKDVEPTKVPLGCCYVLGDNRGNSRDSRHIGFIPIGDIVGVAQYIYFPAESWTRFGRIK
jgi:signal peptidase I